MDDVAKHHIETKPIPLFERSWVETRDPEFGEVDLRKHNYTILNAAGASAGDAVLLLDSDVRGTESQQCKDIQRGFPDLNKEHEKAAKS